MKIFAIRDETDTLEKDLAYLLYYETEKRFYIELPENADPWETPLILESFVKRGEKTVNSYWSMQWVQQRIVPTDRQNLGQILKDNGLKEYDEYSLLMLSMGRCAQDYYYLIPIDEGALPDKIKERFLKRIEDIIPLENYNLLIFFRDGSVKKCSLSAYFKKRTAFAVLLNNEKLFFNVKLQTGGHCVSWDVNLTVSDDALYEMGMDIPLSSADFKNFAAFRVITTAEASDILECSRQNIDDLTRRGKLHPIKTSGRTTLFLRSEVEKRNWQ